jgi:outer membrane protein
MKARRLEGRVFVFLMMLVFLSAGLFPKGASAKEVRIGVVDLQKALNESTRGAQARATFSKRATELQKQIEQRQKELEAMKNELASKASVLSEKARGEKERVYQEKLKDFQRFYRDAQDELRSKDQELTSALLRDIQSIVASIGQKGGYSVILERGESSVLFADKEVDITQAVIDAFNKSSK